MPKVEILVDHIYGENQAKHVKGDIVEVSAETAKIFGDRCKVIAEKKPAAKKTAKAKKDEG